jgi:hypothetical protein
MKAVLLLAFLLAAEEPGGALAPCADDVKKLCADAPEGDVTKIRCLTGHESELSAVCKERIDSIRTRMNDLMTELGKVCGEDAKAQCPDHKWGGGLLPCLAQHEKDLSGPCRDWLQSHKAHGAPH